MTNNGLLAFERTQTFENVFRDKQIIVVKKIILEKYVDANSIINGGYLDDLKNTARSKLKYFLKNEFGCFDSVFLTCINF